MRMSTALAPSLQMEESELISVLQSSIYPGAKLESIKMVLGVCKASGKDPLKKPYHIVPMYVKTGNNSGEMRDVIMPGINDYRTDAARTGQHVGTSEPEFGPDVTEKLAGVEITYPAWCRVTVRRRMDDGTIGEFTAVERWKENYATAKRDTLAPNAMWRKRPYGQIAKCAEAQALRKGFPEVGSQPTVEEMEGKELDVEYIEATTLKSEVQMPKSKGKALEHKPDDSIPVDFTDVTDKQAEKEPAPQQQQKQRQETAGEQTPAGLASPGMRAHIVKKAEEKQIAPQQVFEQFGLDPAVGLDGITEELGGKIIAWIKSK